MSNHNDGSINTDPHPPKNAREMQERIACFINDLQQQRYRINVVHMPIKFTKCLPIGCTWTHAFTVTTEIVGRHTQYKLHAIDISTNKISTPYDAHKTDIEYTCPWKTYPSTFTNFKSACAHFHFVSIITTNTLHVFDVEDDAKWKIAYTMRSTERHNFLTVRISVMNMRYLVCYEPNLDPEKCRLLVMEWLPGTRTATIKVSGVVAIELPPNRDMGTCDRLFVTFDDGSTLIYSLNACLSGLLDVDDSKGKEKMDGIPPIQKVALWIPDEETKGLTPFNQQAAFIRVHGPHVVQGSVNNLSIHGLYTMSIRDLPCSPVDVAFIGNDTMIMHDKIHSLNIWSLSKRRLLCSIINHEILSVPSQLCSVPRASYPYRSMRIFSRRMALLLTTGALCFIIPNSAEPLSRVRTPPSSLSLFSTQPSSFSSSSSSSSHHSLFEIEDEEDEEEEFLPFLPSSFSAAKKSQLSLLPQEKSLLSYELSSSSSSSSSSQTMKSSMNDDD